MAVSEIEKNIIANAEPCGPAPQTYDHACGPAPQTENGGADSKAGGSARRQDFDGRSKIYSLVLTGLMAALVLAATSVFKIPVPATNGYVHIGDAMIFVSVLILGRRNGTIASGTGSALADLLGGYPHWVPWTFTIKTLMAFAFGSLLLARSGASQTKTASRAPSILMVLAMTASSLIMIAGYFIAHLAIYGNLAAPLAALPGNIVQAAAGVLIATLVSAAIPNIHIAGEP